MPGVAAGTHKTRMGSGREAEKNKGMQPNWAESEAWTQHGGRGEWHTQAGEKGRAEGAVH